MCWLWWRWLSVSAWAGFSSHDDRISLCLVGSYSLFMGLQMLLTMHFLQEQMLRLSGPASRLDRRML